MKTRRAPRPNQALGLGGRSRHGRTLWNGIAGPAAVVQPQHRQRHAESAARTSATIAIRIGNMTVITDSIPG